MEKNRSMTHKRGEELESFDAVARLAFLNGRHLLSLPGSRRKAQTSEDRLAIRPASAEIRAQRRVRELLERGMPGHYDDVLLDIRARDERDTHRDIAPLRRAEDAALLDTSDLDIDQSIAEAIRLVEHQLADA